MVYVLILWNRLVTPDPATLGFSFAAWAGIVGSSLVMSGNTFDLSPSWAGIAWLHPSDTEWGIGILVNAALLSITPRLQKIPYRAAVIVFSAIVWVAFGSSLILNAWKAGFFSIVGAYSIWCSIQGLLTAGRWIAEDTQNGNR